MYYEKIITNPSDVIATIKKFMSQNGWTLKTDFKQGNNNGYPMEKDGFCLIFADADNNNTQVGNLIKPNEDAFKLFLTACEDYNSSPASGNMFDQTNIITNVNGDIEGIGIYRTCCGNNNYNPTTGTMDSMYDYRTELRCHSILTNGETYLFSLVTYNKESVDVGKGEYYDATNNCDIVVKKYCQLIAIVKTVATVDNEPKWIISGSYNAATVPDIKAKTNLVDANGNVIGILTELADNVNGVKCIDASSKPLFSINDDGTMFCRIGIDAAEIERGIKWASGCTSTSQAYTGKTIATTIVDAQFNDVPLIPTMKYIQSNSSADYGRNVNTLNGISVNIPIPVFVLRDPDLLCNYSQVGYVGNIFFISMKNFATLGFYEINNPQSGIFYQVYPMCIRGGTHGYDGISILKPSDDTIMTL